MTLYFASAGLAKADAASASPQTNVHPLNTAIPLRRLTSKDSAAGSSRNGAGAPMANEGTNSILARISSRMAPRYPSRLIPAFFSRNVRGAEPVQRLKAREKEAGSEKPVR